MSMFKSLESIDVTKQNVDKEKMSVELYNKLKSTIARTLVRSVGCYLYDSGDSADTLTKKLTAIANDFVSSGDIHRDYTYLVRDTVAAVTSPRTGGFGPYSNIWDTSAWCVCEDPYLFVFGEQDNYTDVEKAMVAEFIEARKRYETIQRKVIHYIDKTCDQIRRDLIVKHSSALEQNAPTWLKEVSSALRLGLPIESKKNV